MVKLNEFGRLIRIFLSFAIFPYFIKPSVIFLSSVTSACFVYCNVKSPLLYKILGSPTTSFLLVIICVSVITVVIRRLLRSSRRVSLIAIILVIVLLLPLQFYRVSIFANLCFSGLDEVSVCRGWICGLEIPSEPNNIVFAVSLKDVGCPPFAIFNGYDIDGFSSEEDADGYTVTIWLNKDARTRLSRILSKYTVVGYSFVHEGNVCYINDVENGIQKDGMYFSWQTTSEEAAVGVMYGTLLTPLPGSSKYFGGMDDFIFRGRILDFALFVDKQRRRSQEGTLDVE